MKGSNHSLQKIREQGFNVCVLLFLFSAFFSLWSFSWVQHHLASVQGCSIIIFFFLLFLAIEVMCCNLDFGLQFMLQHRL